MFYWLVCWHFVSPSLIDEPVTLSILWQKMLVLIQDMPSPEHHGVSNQRQIDRWFSNLFRLRKIKSKLSIFCHLWTESISISTLWGHHGKSYFGDCLQTIVFNMQDDVTNRNIFRVTGSLWGESTGHLWIPSQRPVTRSFEFSLICAWTNGWANTRDADYLRPHRTHYYVTLIGIHPTVYCAVHCWMLSYEWKPNN